MTDPANALAYLLTRALDNGYTAGEAISAVARTRDIIDGHRAEIVEQAPTGLLHLDDRLANIVADGRPLCGKRKAGKRGGGRRVAAGKSKPGAGEKPIGKREARRLEIKALNAEGLTPKAIGSKLKPKITEGAVRLALKKMELEPNDPPAKPDGRKVPGRTTLSAGDLPSPATSITMKQAITVDQLLGFLREIGAKASATAEAGQFLLEGKTVDAIGLLEYANTWRRRNKQPPFTLKRG